MTKISYMVLALFLSLILILNFSSAIKNSPLGKTTKELLENQKNREERNQLKTEVVFWENQVLTNQPLRDLNFKTAVLHYKLGNLNQSKKYLHKTLSLDPNFKEARKLEEILKK